MRVPRHCENALAVAKFLSTSSKIDSVCYPSLPGDASYELAQKYLPQGSCGVVSFEVAGGRSAAVRFMEALKVASIETHVADARTCCLHPASSTHRQMTDEELLAAGIGPSMVRLSCGLEGTEDLVADVAQALELV